jgi:hypothetical protein
MKSVIQEASSLSKAIEQGWTKAGKPQEFSIRILQEPSKNFLGITLQNAKVAVFFGKLQDMPPAQKEKPHASPRQQPPRKKTFTQRPQQQAQPRTQTRRPHYKRPPQQQPSPSAQTPSPQEKK